MSNDKKLEAPYCRSMAARTINQSGVATWIYNTNNGKGYISGRPDAEVLCFGDHLPMVFVECKADKGSLYLGNPDDPDDTSGWHPHQRSWYEKVAKRAGAHYYLLTWLYPRTYLSFRPQKEALLYLVHPDAWLALEASIQDRHNSKTAKVEEVEAAFAPCRVTWKNLTETIVGIAKGEQWQITKQMQTLSS